jgi:hypothetical protein
VLVAALAHKVTAFRLVVVVAVQVRLLARNVLAVQVVAVLQLTPDFLAMT